jgi:glutamate synthase (ferredoxin)
VLSDKGVSATHAPIPMLLAVGAVHHHLIRARKRMRASLLVESGEPREDHHIACLISYGASLVHPYLAFETVAELAALRAANDPTGTAPPMETSLNNYRTALQDGLLRIMSKMGIATMDSYRGAQVRCHGAGGGVALPPVASQAHAATLQPPPPRSLSPAASGV